MGILTRVKSWFTEKTVGKYIGSPVRHSLGWIAGALGAISIPGVADLGLIIIENMGRIETAVVSIVTYAVVQAWSFFQKKKS